MSIGRFPLRDRHGSRPGRATRQEQPRQSREWLQRRTRWVEELPAVEVIACHQGTDKEKRGDVTSRWTRQLDVTNREASWDAANDAVTIAPAPARQKACCSCRDSPRGTRTRIPRRYRAATSSRALPSTARSTSQDR